MCDTKGVRAGEMSKVLTRILILIPYKLESNQKSIL